MLFNLLQYLAKKIDFLVTNFVDEFLLSKAVFGYLKYKKNVKNKFRRPLSSRVRP